VALMAAYLLSPPGMPWTDANGDPLNGGLIYVYQAGTSTLTDSYPTYADAVALTNPNTNPVVLNATGLPSSGVNTIGIWLASGLYKIIVRNSAGVLIQTEDSVGDNSGTDVLPPNYLAGLDLGINALDAANDIDIAAGAARDAADSEDMTLASALVKQTNAAWAVGTNAGGLDTGSLAANTQYYVWLIKRTDTGVVDVLFSTSNSSPTMPTNYDKKRLIGSFKTGATAVIDPATLFSASESMPNNPTTIRLTDLPELLEITRITTAAALVEWTSSSYFNGAYRALEIRIFEAVPTTDSIDWDMYYRVGASYVTTTTYAGSSFGRAAGGAVTTGGNTVARILLNAVATAGNVGGVESLSGRITVNNVGVTGLVKRAEYVISYGNGSGTMTTEIGSYANTGTTVLDGIKIQPSSGTIQVGAVFELWGYR
jgi:hypothetical protein